MGHIRQANRLTAGMGTMVGASMAANFPYDAGRTITQATKYYVSPTGSDGNAGTSEGAPFATIAHALTVAGPDTAILLMNGTHVWDSADSKFVGASGTSGAPCLFTSLPGHLPVINCNGAAFGLSVEKSYWSFTHLKLTNYVRGIKFGENQTCTGCSVDSVLGETTLGGDNSGLIALVQVSRTPSMAISNVRGVNTGTSLHQNTGGIYLVRTTDTAISITNCEFIGGPIGIHFKHGNPTPSVQNCTVSNVACIGQTRWAVGPNPSGVVFTNCIFGDGAGVTIPADNGGEAGDLNTFDHCTFYDGIILDTQTAGANNNLFTDCLLMSLNKKVSSSVSAASNYNLYPASSITWETVAKTLAQYQTLNSSDANSVEGTPVFAGTDFTAIASYALASGPGKNAASDGADIGCNVATVGIA